MDNLQVPSLTAAPLFRYPSYTDHWSEEGGKPSIYQFISKSNAYLGEMLT